MRASRQLFGACHVSHIPFPSNPAHPVHNTSASTGAHHALLQAHWQRQHQQQPKPQHLLKLLPQPRQKHLQQMSTSPRTPTSQPTTT